MCGRYVAPEVAQIEQLWHIGARNWGTQVFLRFNLAPTATVPVLLAAPGGALELTGARWGLIPSWWQREALPTLSFNARSEEAADKPMWRNSLRGMRCLMPVQGWYEWNENEPVRGSGGRRVNQPYYLCSPDTPVMAFAGLWSSWRSPAGVEVLSCALLSRAAAPSIAAIHHRMPVVLAPEAQEAWLDPSASPATVQALIDAARGDFTGHRVSLRVNSVRNADAGLLEPVAPQPPEAEQSPPPAAQDDLFGGR